MSDRVGLQFGDFTLYASEHLLLRDGRPVLLTPKAFDLLVTLTTRPGRLITKDELLREVWPDSFVEESNLAYHVFALRKALGETADGAKYVETVPKRGYRFVAPVTPVNGAGGSLIPAQPTWAPGANLDREQEVRGPESNSRHQSNEADERTERPAASTPAVGRVPARLFSRRPMLWFAAGAFAAGTILMLLYPGRAPVARAPVRVEISTEVRLTESSAFALSPDGRRLVFAGSGPDGIVRLWIRSLDTDEARPLPGTEVALGGLVPPMFWSPDSRFVAFDAAGQLKKVEITGGAPQTVCALPGLAVGGSWNQNDVILVGSPQGGIVRCPASGGAASIVTQPDVSRQQSAHVFPWFLPDGRRFLYLSVSRAAPENTALYTHTLDTPPESSSSTRVLASGFGAAYVPDGDGEQGHLLFLRDGTLLAQPFDPARLQLSGQAYRIAEPVGSFLDGGFFSAATNGALVFRAPAETLTLTWLDRRGGVIGRISEPGRYSGLAVAPGDRRAAVVRHAVRATVDQDLWLVDLQSGGSSRVTFDAALEESPVWSNDGKRIIFTTGGGIGSLFEQSISSEQAPHLLLHTPQHKIPTSMSRDGRFLLYTNVTLGPTRVDIWTLPLFGERRPFPLIRRAFDQSQARFSPDGQWVAYVSNESGRQEILVRPFSVMSMNNGELAGESTIVSKSGGSAPRWSADGKELYFITPDGAITSVAVSAGPALDIGAPTTLFQVPGLAAYWDVAAWDVSEDGTRFLVIAPDVPSPTSFSLILDWQGMLDE